MANSFQIIGGKHRGRKFSFPNVLGLRPSPNKVRETLFNWLQFETHNKTFLDLFAGSGALGFEALSRGAKSVVSIEQDANAFDFLVKNKALLKADNLTIFQKDALLFLQKPPAIAFDFVLLDPPFNKNYVSKVLKLIIQNSFVASGGKIYIESEFKINADMYSTPINIIKQKQSASVHYCLLNLKR
jgi:16S rRNA (guanine966-N2)-methyltransferase